MKSSTLSPGSTVDMQVDYMNAAPSSALVAANKGHHGKYKYQSPEKAKHKTNTKNANKLQSSKVSKLNHSNADQLAIEYDEYTDSDSD